MVDGTWEPSAEVIRLMELDLGSPPTDRILDVCDGGANWGVFYDPVTGQFSGLAFNGVG